jgi:flagellar hook-length control protein FliK
MSIESVSAIPVPRVAEAVPGAAKSAAPEKEPKGFSDVMNGLDAGEDDAPSDQASQTEGAKDADSVGDKKAAKKLPSKKIMADGAAPDAAMVIASFIQPTVPPTNAAPVDAAVTQDGMAAESLALVANAGGGAATAAADVRSQALAVDARANSVGLANYASVFEQIQSRMAKRDSSSVELAQSAQPGAEVGLKGGPKPTLGTAAADARSDRLSSLGSGAFVLPVAEPSAMQAVTDATEALKLASVDTKIGEAGKSSEGMHAPQHFTPTVQFESTSKSVDLSQASPERAVADQVSYWISQGVQNAELTFSGVDSQPVEVHISLSGNEAHVAFRSDQAETRDFLTGASGHLKDLLQSEGMVLSGMSVGSSGAENSGARERRAPSETAQRNTRQAREEVVVRPVALPRASGRAVDLFV